MKRPILLNGDETNPIGTIDLPTSIERVMDQIPVQMTPIFYKVIGQPSELGAWAFTVIPPKFDEPEDLKISCHPIRMIDDPRPITMITFPFQEPDQPGITIGCKLYGQDVTKIVAYEEAGEMSHVLWYAIYGRHKLTEGITFGEEEIIYRIQGKYIESVGYQEEGAA